MVSSAVGANSLAGADLIAYRSSINHLSKRNKFNFKSLHGCCDKYCKSCFLLIDVAKYPLFAKMWLIMNYGLALFLF